MKLHYEIAFTDEQGERQFLTFTTKKKALQFANKLNLKCIEIYIDTYDEDGDLINYKCLKYE